MNENNFEKYMAIYPCILEKEKRKKGKKEKREKGKKRTRCHLLWTTTAYECRFRGVAVITSASHAEGPQFDPGREQDYFLGFLFYFFFFLSFHFFPPPNTRPPR